MGSWRFEISGNAEGDLQKIGEPTKTRILEKVKWFRNNFKQVRPISLGGKWQGFFKLRVGDWRIVYEIEQEKRLVTIHYIDHRSKIYKRR